MPRRSGPFALLAACLAAAACLVLLLTSPGPRPASVPHTRTDESLARSTEAPPSAPEAEAPPLEGGDAEPSRTVAAPSASASRIVRVRGRLVMEEGGDPPRDASVAVRASKEEIDYPETWDRLGGKEAVEELRRTGEFAAHLAALGGWKPAFQARADAEGQFEIALPIDLPRFRFDVEADFAAYTSQQWFDLDSPEIAGGVILLLEAAGAIEGAVASAEGPARGARVGIGSRPSSPGLLPRTQESTADDAGRFLLRGVPPGEYEIGATAPVSAPATTKPVLVAARGVTRVDLVLPRESAVSGRVVDETGRGIPDVRVRTNFEFTPPVLRPFVLSWRGPTRSDGEGRFRVGSLPAGRHTLLVEKPHRIPRDDLPVVELSPESEVGGLEIILAEGASLSGRVVDAEGRPVAGARVVAQTDSPQPKPVSRPRHSKQRGETGPDGSFRLAGLGNGVFHVGARSEGRGTASKAQVPGGTTDLELVLEPFASLAGIVAEADTGRSVRRFSLRANRTAEGLERQARFEDFAERLLFAEDGAFEVRDLVAGTYDLFVRAEEFIPKAEVGIEVRPGESRGGIEIRLERAATVRGVVMEEGSGVPVKGARVTSVRGGDVSFPMDFGMPGRFEVIASDGSFTLRNREPGTFRLVARHEGFADGASEPIEARAGESMEGVRILLSRGGGVDGFAVSEGGDQFAGGFASAASETPVREGKWARIDAAGYFRIEGLRPGLWEVMAVSPRRLRPDRTEADRLELRASVRVEDGKTTRVEFSPPPKGCTVRGRVLRGDEPVASAWLRIKPRPADGDGRGDARRVQVATVKDGAFTIERVPAGEASIGVEASFSRLEGGGEHVSVTTEATIPDAPEFSLEIRLPVGGEIVGRVLRAEDGSPVAGISVGASFQAPSSKGPLRRSGGWATTDDEGRYRIRGLAPAAYRLHASRPSRSPFGGPSEESAEAPQTKEPVEVGEGTTTTVDFALERAGTAVVEVLDPKGEPRSGLWVGLLRAAQDGGTEASWGGSGRTNEKGLVRIGGLAPGFHYAAAETEGFAHTFSDEASVRPGEETRFRIRLQEGMRVLVHVEDAEGERVPNPEVEARDSKGRTSRFQARPSAEGPGTVAARLAPGDYSLVVRSSGFQPSTVSLRVAAGSEPRLSVRLERETRP